MKHQKLAASRSPNWAFMESFRIPNGDDLTKDYLVRLRILQTPWFGIMLHRMYTPDTRAVLHDHPWPFVSFILRGGYTEYVPGPGASSPESLSPYAVPRKINRINIKRFNNSYHWIAELDRVPTWTLVFTGRRRRVWGYLERDGRFVRYDEHENHGLFEAALEARGGGDLM